VSSNGVSIESAKVVEIVKVTKIAEIHLHHHLSPMPGVSGTCSRYVPRFREQVPETPHQRMQKAPRLPLQRRRA